MKIAVTAGLLALMPALASADDAAGMTCAEFARLAVPEQVAALSTLEPLGDEMNPSDAAASEDWAGAVTTACRDRPDALLPDAARNALGE